ncbi:MAG: M23 family metallopeptidase [Clostridia bacterium]|nr:M23 family metallopeptidase [Clostridia bacterium]
MKKLFLTIILIAIAIFMTYSVYIIGVFSSDELGYPTEYTAISSYYGFRLLYGKSNFHNGIDFLAPQGSNIYAAESGIVDYVGFMSDGSGNTISISHGSGISTMYCHTDETFLVNVGDFVQKGQIIGHVGPQYLSSGIMNGNTTGPHLHFMVLKDGYTVNPLAMI